MALTSGSKLGPYEIQSPLGAGGMGEVYRARDTRLDRSVAIKVLASHLSSSPELKQRMEREARAVSSLNHPHICHLYDIGSQDGIDFLVMELIEGETLAERLRKGAMPLAEILKVGIALAEALAVAHRQGIVHRDLKPGNIMLTQQGAKLMDFGLAKSTAAGLDSAASKAPLLLAAQTMSEASPLTPLTTAGALVGTIQYMSPEQIEGREADARSDIFAFGALLYEMVTGRRAFEGRSQISVASAILEKEPKSIKEVQRAAPPALDHLIRTCLAKNPEERYQSALDVKLQLLWIAQAGPDRTAAASAAAASSWRKILPWALAGALGVTALALAATYLVTRPAPGATLMVSLIPPAGVFPDIAGRNGAPQISLDGKRLAFVGCKTTSASASIVGSKSCSIWVRSLNSNDAHEVAGTNGGYGPFWSPDGREIAFFADGKLKRVLVDGGAVQVVCDADDGRGGSWASSGTIIFAATRGSPIFRVPADGGTPVAMTRSTPASNLAEFGSHRWPHFFPDGEHFVYVNAPNGACTNLTEMRFAALDGKQDFSLMRSCSSAAFASGHLIFWRDGNLVAQPFDPRSGALSGNAVPIAQHVAFDALFSFSEFSAAADGIVAYVNGEGLTGAQLIWYDRSGNRLGKLGDNDQYASVSISRDGSRVVADTTLQGESTIRLLDARGTRTLITTQGGTSGYPVFSADGAQVYFTSSKNGPYDIFVKAVDGSSDEREVLKFDKGLMGAVFLAASPNGKYLAFQTADPVTKKLNVSVLPLVGERIPRTFLNLAVDYSAPAFSPDGKWLAYEAGQGAKREVYITPFPAGGAQYAVSTNGGERPVWRRDGKEVYYREGLRLMSVAVKGKGEAVELSPPSPLFEVAARNMNGRWYDVGPDGHFLMNTSPNVSQAENFELLINWPAELSK
jgi:Tol biopolymer transport system component/tRNA A-37 threonylcarbamoyl transferase component Bud32